MKRKLCLLMVAFLLLAFGTASAYTFPLYIGTAEQPGTQFEDNDLDYWLDEDQSGDISVGDILYSAIEFENVLDLATGAPAYNLDTAADELVAFGAIKVATKTDTLWTFEQVDASTPMVQVYTGGDIDLDLFTIGSDPTLAEAQAAIFDGIHLWDFSLTADPDTFWAFSPNPLFAADDPSVVAGLNSTTKVGTLNFALNLVWGEDIFDPIFSDFVFDDGLVDLVGSGDILGGQGLINGAFARSDVDVLVNPIPEPSTLILLGAGLLGLFAVVRKKSRS